MSAGPPPNAPLVSPDGKWVWDGTRWQPIAPVLWKGPDPGVSADKLPQAAAMPVARPMAGPPPDMYMPQQQRGGQGKRVQTPHGTVIPYAMPVDQVDATPLWKPKVTKQGPNPIAYVVAGVVAIVVLFVAVNQFYYLLPWAPTPPAAKSGPAQVVPPATSRSDFVRADRYLTYVVTPALDTLNQNLEPVKSTCNGTLSNLCYTAVVAATPATKSTLAAIDHAQAPLCIVTDVAKVRGDVAYMDAALQLVLQGFNDNKSAEAGQGFFRFKAGVSQLQTDAHGADLAHQAKCNTQESGP